MKYYYCPKCGDFVRPKHYRIHFQHISMDFKNADLRVDGPAIPTFVLSCPNCGNDIMPDLSSKYLAVMSAGPIEKSLKEYAYDCLLGDLGIEPTDDDEEE